jgi:hypothetical protein
MYSFAKLLVVVLPGLCCLSCKQTVTVNCNVISGGCAVKNTNEPCDFGSIVTGSLVSNNCSPRITDYEFRGILINAPETVCFDESTREPLTGSFAKIIIAGAYRFKYDTLGLNGRFLESILLVAVDSTTHKVYSGKLRVFETPARQQYKLADDGLSEDDFEDYIITEYFNPDISTALSLPPAEAQYVVYATLGPYKSNAVSINVRRKE